MTVADLKDLLKWQRRIDNKKLEIEMIKRDLTFIRGLDYTKERTGAGPESTAEDFLCELISKETQIKKEMKELYTQKEKAKQEIEKMDKYKHKQVLFFRYYLCQKWEEIADVMGYEKGYLYKIHRQALNSFENMQKRH